MKKRKVWLGVGIGLAVLLIVGGGFIFYNMNTANPVFGSEEFPLYAENVSDFMGMEMDMGAFAAFSGKVEAERMEKIYYDPAEGTIKEVFVSEGDAVEEGTTLFEYEPEEDLSIEKDQKQIELEMAYMDINRLQKQKERLEKQIKNAGATASEVPEEEGEEISFADEKETLQQELDQVIFDLRMSNLQAGQVQKEIEAFKEEEKSPVVVSKGPGIVQTINQDLLAGAPYGEESGASGPLLTIVSTGAYLIKSEVNELLLDTIAVGDKVQVSTKKGIDGEWIGEITEIGKLPVGEGEGDMNQEMYYYEEGNPQTSKYPFTVLLNEHEGLEIGFHVNLAPITGNSESEPSTGAVMIPIDYIVQDEEVPFVWAVNLETNETYKQEVEFAETDDGYMVEILTGLTMDDSIVFPDPSTSIEEGKKVEVLDYDTTEEY
ncbi:efflux RND transporter periplasmic adaptor subunit [Oceanobacillus sp. 143]|uniref:ABC transporter n=1 Tax=Oceanobacillus zhaokaii TaxID=2052660 RepID=A0A345PL54_9BACI|nr:efflux RND transporter periplasmic adaptor subunit [Oceanobacillus zhaokaii]AXI10734.1 ABC transporter [Oceanobacillus zhaokaii]QGS69661.1 efflux RND transporter periplasmic adaptor subunit [Oceanobacillus sp. 143]